MSIKDKITPGKWFINDYYVRVEFQTAPIGQAFVAIVPGPHNNFAEDKEGKANARLFSKSKEMLDILEDLAWYHDTCRKPSKFIKRIGTQAKELLKQLNDESNS